jgi:hypothetical protein
MFPAKSGTLTVLEAPEDTVATVLFCANRFLGARGIAAPTIDISLINSLRSMICTPLFTVFTVNLFLKNQDNLILLYI